MGVIALLGVFAVSWLAAWSLGTADERRSVVDGSLYAFAIWQTALLALIYALGFASSLNVGSVAIPVVITSLVTLAWRLRDATVRDDALKYLRACASAPVATVREVVAENRVLLIPLVAAVLMLAWFLIATWYLPPKNHWDGIWYHDTIIGFTIQNQGFAAIDLPRTTQAVNGVPRSVNMMQTFVALFAGRHLVELPNVLGILLGAIALVGLARRFALKAGFGVGAACLFVLMPGIDRFATSTMVDAYSASLTIIAAYFVFRERLRPLDVVLAGGVCAALVGSKYVALVPAGMLMAMLVFRGLAEFVRERRGRILAALVVAAGFVFAMMSATFVRNYINFENPVWPHGTKIEALDIDWKPSEPKTKIHAGKEISFGDAVNLFIAVPYSKKSKSPYFHTTGTHDYGGAFNWVVLPLGLLAALWLLFAAAAAKVRGESLDSAHRRALMLALVAWTQLFLFPPIWAARYQLGAAALLPIVIGVLAARRRWRTESASLLAAAGLIAVVNVSWQSQQKLLPRAKWVGGAMQNPPGLAGIDDRFGSPVKRKLGKLREELGPDDLVVYDSMTFPSLLFNNRYDNRVQYVHPRDLYDRLDTLAPTWIYAKNHANQRRLDRDPNWEKLGVLESVRRTRRGYIYHRVAADR